MIIGNNQLQKKRLIHKEQDMLTVENMISCTREVLLHIRPCFA